MLRFPVLRTKFKLWTMFLQNCPLSTSTTADAMYSVHTLVWELDQEFLLSDLY